MRDFDRETSLDGCSGQLWLQTFPLPFLFCNYYDFFVFKKAMNVSIKKRSHAESAHGLQSGESKRKRKREKKNHDSDLVCLVFLLIKSSLSLAMSKLRRHKGDFAVKCRNSALTSSPSGNMVTGPPASGVQVKCPKEKEGN